MSWPLDSGGLKEREDHGILRRRTRNIGRFEHVVPLPCDINPDRAEASLADGVMTVRMGTATTEKSRHIPVKGTLARPVCHPAVRPSGPYDDRRPDPAALWARLCPGRSADPA